MEPSKEPLSSLTDDELFDALKRLASMWFKNSDILILEELFRRYKHAKSR